MARSITFVNVPLNTTPPPGAPTTSATNLNRIQDETVEVYDEGALIAVKRALNFIGAGVSISTTGNTINVTVPGISGAAASSVSFTPGGGIESNNVQEAIAEVAASAAGTYTLPDASTSVKGGVLLSIAPSGSPIALGENDGRVPSQGENDALAGTSGTPSNSNRFVTNADGRLTDDRDPTAHTHPISDVTSLQTSLDAKAPLAFSAVAISGNTTLAIVTHSYKVLEVDTTAASRTITVPTNTTAAFPIGSWIEIYCSAGANDVIIAPADGTVLIREREGKLKLAGLYATARLRKRGTNEWVLAGDVKL
jgi:hypothetical protein